MKSINTEEPFVSVIMPTYNHARYIGEAIDSVFSQTYDNYELIIVDNYSTDETVEVVKSYQSSKIKLIQFLNNDIIAASRNVGIRTSKGKYIAFLDSDDLWVPDKLKIQMEYFNKNLQVGLVYSKYTSFKEGKKLRTKPEKGYSGSIFTKLLSKSIMQTSTVMVKKECLDAIGLFDESFALADEYDLFLRIARKFQCGFVDKELTKYRVHDSNASKNDFLFDKENLRVYKRVYDNYTDLDRKTEKILKKRIARYSLKVARRFYAQGQLEESIKYHKEAFDYLPLFKRIIGNLRFKFNHL